MNINVTEKEFQEELGEILRATEGVLGIKAAEYTRNDNRMHNFDQGAAMTGKIRERIIEDFRLKHEISRKDIINDFEQHGKLPTKELLDEKYGDIINYFILEKISLTRRIKAAQEDLQIPS